MKIVGGDDGTGQIIVTVGDLEMEEFAATLQAFLDLPLPATRLWTSLQAETASAPAPRSAHRRPQPFGAESQRLHGPGTHRPRHADGGHAAGDDRYLVHLVTRPDGRHLTTLDGRPSTPATPPWWPAIPPP